MHAIVKVTLQKLKLSGTATVIVWLLQMLGLQLFAADYILRLQKQIVDLLQAIFHPRCNGYGQDW